MMASEFDKYLKQNGKTELFITKRLLKNKNAARDKLKRLLSEKWLWFIIPNNCTDFVEEIIGAGENDFGLISNCPTQLSLRDCLKTKPLILLSQHVSKNYAL